MLVFVANDENGLPQKRKHVQRACDRCRKRKKRCEHLNGAQRHEDIDVRTSHTNTPGGGKVMLSAATASHSPQSMPSTKSLPREIFRDTASSTPAASAASVPPIGYKSPARVSEQTSETVPERIQAPESKRASEITNRTVSSQGQEFNEEAEAEDSSFVGDLNPEAIFLAATSPQTTMSGENERVGVWSTRKAIDSIRASLSGPSHQIPSNSILNADPVVSRLLLPYLQDQCMKLLPNKADYIALETMFFEEVQPLFPVLDAVAFRSLPDSSPSKILMKQAICLAVSTNPEAKTHLSLDLGLRMNPKEFAEKMSRAIRTSLDLGLVRDKLVLIQVLALLSLFTQLSDDKHLSAELSARAVSLVQTVGLHLRTQTRKDHSYVTRLFCCIWTLDRLNAAFHGRPVLMHERDFGRDMTQSIRDQEPAFQLILRIVNLLNKVISLYRPTNEISENVGHAAFPMFEELLEGSGAQRVKSHLLATIEVFYHAVAMLSCRAQSSQEATERASSAAQVRQILSMSRVTFIVGEEFRGQLSLLPFVPYSLSLALKVSYRELRTSKASIFRARARKQILEQCRLLRELGEVFWSAVVMVELAEQTIREMDKVTFNVIGQQHQQQQSSKHQCLQDDLLEKEQQQLNGEAADAASNFDGNTQEADAAANLWHPPRDEMAPLPSTYDPNDFDLSLIDDMADFDVFQHFDPSIDLDTIDATLGDFSQPCEFMGFPG